MTGRDETKPSSTQPPAGQSLLTAKGTSGTFFWKACQEGSGRDEQGRVFLITLKVMHVHDQILIESGRTLVWAGLEQIVLDLLFNSDWK